MEYKLNQDNAGYIHLRIYEDGELVYLFPFNMSHVSDRTSCSIDELRGCLCNLSDWRSWDNLLDEGYEANEDEYDSMDEVRLYCVEYGKLDNCPRSILSEPEEWLYVNEEEAVDRYESIDLAADYKGEWMTGNYHYYNPEQGIYKNLYMVDDGGMSLDYMGAYEEYTYEDYSGGSNE